MFRVFSILVAFGLAGLASADTALPYWASLKTGEAMMRTGPGRQFPASWRYRRAGLPVKVIETYPSWRKVTDPDGTTGWMLANLISEQRTAIVVGGVRDMHATAALDAPVVWRAEAGVVGTLSQCARGWCLLDVKGRSGYIQTAHLWGTAADERLP